MTDSNLTIQKVNGLIRRSPVTFTSTKLPSYSRHVRTPGLYAYKARTFEQEIRIGFDTWGYEHNAEIRDEELNAFIAFAEAEGYTITKAGREYVIDN